MTRRRLLMAAAAVALLVMVLPGAATAIDTPSVPISDGGVAPVLVPGNPDCEDIGLGYGFKINDSPNGTFYFTGAYGELTGGAPADPNNYVTIFNSDGITFDWMASLGIDAVIVKGGPNANSYIYIPEADADGGLGAPLNPANGQPYGISHIEFCYDYEVDVSKTANTTFTRTWDWDITKSVTPATWNLFTGDSGTSEYTVFVDKTGYTDSNWAVSGSITIENNTPLDATIASVSDAISGFGAVAVDCGVTFPYLLASGGTLVCAYSTALPNGDGRTNTATAATTGMVGGGTANAAVVFGAPTTENYASVNVTDTNGMSWGPISDDATFTYSKTFTCDGDEGQHDNTATITETGDYDDASVTVNCYALGVTKDADTSLTRTWNWTIDKIGDQTALTLSIGQQFLVNYQVTVGGTPVDSAWAVEGDISVYNPAPMAATINSVTDLVSPAIAAAVDCGVTFPYSLASLGTLYCSYDALLPDGTTRTNTATAVLQNYDYDKDLNATADGTTNFTGTASVDFSTATITEIDECIDVTDDHYGFLGTVCADDLVGGIYTFNYSMYVGPYEVCGYYEYTNVASFLTNDTGTTGSDSWTVTINVPCPGCTLTPGYWKTHSAYGPAPYDETWALLSSGAETPFFLSGQTYYQALWTAPAGNVYYILAHAYIAAELNFLNGASSTPEVDAAFAAATSLFNTYTPAQVAAFKGKGGSIVRAQFIYLAGILDSYNNGYIGPGHCSE